MPTAKSTKGANVNVADRIGEGNGERGRPLPASFAENPRTAKFEAKAKQDVVAADEQATLSDATGEGGAESNSIVLAQALTAAGNALTAKAVVAGTGDDAPDARAEGEGADTMAAASSAASQPLELAASDISPSMTRQGIGNAEPAPPGAADTSSPAAGTTGSGAVGAESAGLSSGFAPLLALPLAALAGGGGGGGGGSSAPITPPVLTAATVSLSAAATVPEGTLIIYTASVGANPVHSDVTVTLTTGQTITILAGQTSGTVSAAVPADVYAGTPAAQVTAIASVSGTGGFDSLTFSQAVVSTAVTDVVNVTTVSLSGTAAVAEGGAITYTASVGANPVHSAMTVTLDSGQTITIAAGQTSGAMTVAAPADVYAGTPGTHAAAIASVGGSGGFERLTFNAAAVSTAVSDVIDVTTVSLGATAPVAGGGGTITYTASLGANPVHSDVTVALDNGQTITIAAGQTSGALTVLAQTDAVTGAPVVQSAAIAGVTGDGGFESLTFDVGFNLAGVAADLLDPANAALVSGAAGITLLDSVSLVSADALLALNANAFYHLLDTAANLLNPLDAATVTAANTVTVTGPAILVADADAVLALNANTTGYDLSDTAANLLVPIDAATLAGANSVTVSDQATLSVADADTLLNAPNVSMTYNLSDTAANLLVPADAATVVGAVTVTVTGPAISVADADTLLALTQAQGINLADTAANLLVPGEAATVNVADTVTVTGPAIPVADADLLLALNANTTGYDLSDTAADLFAAIDVATVPGAHSVTVTGAAISVVDADALLALNAQTSGYVLFDTAADLLVPTDAATVSGAAVVLVSDFIPVADADALLALNASTSYSLSDTAADLVAAAPAVLSGADAVTVTDAVTVAQAAIIHGEAPTAAYGIADAAATLATALDTASPNLAATEAAGTIAVTDPTPTLAVNGEEFVNLLAGSGLLAANDAIAVDGVDISVDLGSLRAFGGDVTQGITLGGAQNGSYVVDLGASGEQTIAMEGTGQQQITAATGTLEKFVMGATATGGSTISNLDVGDDIDVGAGGQNILVTQVASASQVILQGQWALVGNALTFWDFGHNQADTLTVLFGAGATTLQLQPTQHDFKVV